MRPAQHEARTRIRRAETMSSKHSTRPVRGRRKGAAATEFAICLPVLLVMIFGSIEACNAIFLDHSTLIVAYEGIREAVKPNSTNALVQQRCNELIASREIESATVTLTPADIAAANRGDNIVVTVTAPCDDNSFLAGWFFAGRSVASSVTMVKE